MAAAGLAALAPGQWETRTRALALAVLRDDATFTVDDPRFSTAVVVGPSMLSTDGAEHDRHRAAIRARTGWMRCARDHTGGGPRRLRPLIDGFADAARRSCGGGLRVRWRC